MYPSALARLTQEACHIEFSNRFHASDWEAKYRPSSTSVDVTFIMFEQRLEWPTME